MSDDLAVESSPSSSASPVLEPASEPPSEPPAEPSSSSSSSASSPSKKSSQWTPEKRAALSATMKQKHAEKQVKEKQQEQSAFAMTEDHEFPTSPAKLPAQVDRVDIYSQHRDGSTALVDSIPVRPADPPPLPGTALSPFRRCSCLGVLPGRVCTFCYGTKWIKLCPKCEGEGRIHLSVRKGAERSQPCGHCGGRGTLPANMKEVTEATQLAEEFDSTHTILPVPESEGFRRAVRLPGIGVTATKRTGTLLARKREKKRNQARKQQRSGQKSAVA